MIRLLATWALAFVLALGPAAAQTNWPPSISSRVEVLGAAVGGAGAGTVVTSSASANTKGSWAAFGATTFNYSGLLLTLYNITNSTNVRLDLGLGSSPSTNACSSSLICIVEDLWFRNTVSGAASGTIRQLLLPIAVASGETVNARISATAGSSAVAALLTGYSLESSGRQGKARLRTATDFTNTLPANTVALSGTAGTYSNWAVVTTSTPARFSQLWCVLADGNDTSRTAGTYIVDIGVGATNSEKLLFSFITGTGTGGLTITPHVPFPVDLPAGSQLNFRATANTTATDSVAASCNGLE